MEAKAIQRRSSPRYPLACDLSSSIFLPGDSPFRCMGTDVSREGLGIVAFEPLQASEKLVLRTEHYTVHLLVRWCRPDQNRTNIFHIGLQAEINSHSLIHVIYKAGLIDKEHPGLKDIRALEPKVLGEAFHFNFKEVKDLLNNLHTPDRELLRRNYLDQLGDSFKAYPIAHQGESIVVLIPIDDKPQDVKSLPDDKLAEQVMLLKKISDTVGDVRWGRIWPLAPVTSES